MFNVKSTRHDKSYKLAHKINKYHIVSLKREIYDSPHAIENKSQTSVFKGLINPPIILIYYRVHSYWELVICLSEYTQFLKDYKGLDDENLRI